MSDPKPEFAPPPPPPGTPPPAFQAPPGYAMPPSYQPAPVSYQPAQGYAPTPGYIPPASGYAPAVYGAAAGFSLMSQFTGIALWSIILGAVSVGVPIATYLSTGGTVTFFYVLPIVGLIRGFTAISRGQVIGGMVGMGLNAIGGLISLFASGVL
jgi:hypothetical protein